MYLSFSWKCLFVPLFSSLLFVKVLKENNLFTSIDENFKGVGKTLSIPWAISNHFVRDKDIKFTTIMVIILQIEQYLYTVKKFK